MIFYSSLELFKLFGKNFDESVRFDQFGGDRSYQMIDRKSFYEFVDVDVIFCYGVGLLKVIDEKLDVIVFYIQVVEDSCLCRRSIYEFVDVDVIFCFGVGLLKIKGERVDILVFYNQFVVDKSCQKIDRRSIYELEDIDIIFCYDVGRLKLNSEKLDVEVFENQ